jgi:carbon storage regulator
MLVITRKPEESFTIGDNIEVTIGEIRGNQIRVIIDAPRSLSIKRTKPMKNNKNNKPTAIDQAKKWGFL